MQTLHLAVLCFHLLLWWICHIISKYNLVIMHVCDIQWLQRGIGLFITLVYWLIIYAFTQLWWLYLDWRSGYFFGTRFHPSSVSTVMAGTSKTNPLAGRSLIAYCTGYPGFAPISHPGILPEAWTWQSANSQPVHS